MSSEFRDSLNPTSHGRDLRLMSLPALEFQLYIAMASQDATAYIQKVLNHMSYSKNILVSPLITSVVSCSSPVYHPLYNAFKEFRL